MIDTKLRTVIEENLSVVLDYDPYERFEGVVGMAFEVRSCYQIGDSKRIQADRDLALSLKRDQIEPIMLIFCVISLSSPVRRLSNYWTIYEGKHASGLTHLDCSCPIHRAYRGKDAPLTPPSVPPQAGGRALTVRLRKSYAFDFVYELTQFDLYGFLRQERETINNLMDSIFEMM